MLIQCRLIDIEYTKGGNIKPGDMWYAPWYLNDDGTLSENDQVFSPEYKRDWLGKRPPLAVCLPNGHHWMPDIKFGDGHGGYKENGWTVTGEAPNITASPSINSSQGDPKGYHGWLQNGILSNDLEGRSY